MKNKTYMLNTILATLMGVDYLMAVLVRTFAPGFVIPTLTVTNMVAFSLLALVVEYYLAPNAKRCYVCIAVLSALSIGLLPLAACFVTAYEAVKLAVVGAVVFTAVTWIFTSMVERIATGPKAKAAPIISALGIYLAAQCLMGIL